MSTTPARRKPRQFTTGAKVAATTAAVTALLGGWNLIGHLDAAQAASKAGAQNNATIDNAAPQRSLMLPTVTPTVEEAAGLPPITFAPIPTLLPASTILQAAIPNGGTGTNLGAITLPSLQALAPLPTMEPLPALPSLPPPPAQSSGGGGGGGNSGGGGGNSGGGGGGSQQSGGS